MKKLILIFMAMLGSMVSRAEDFPLVRETMSLSLQVRQKPGTEGLLKKYLSSVTADQDTIYAMLYEPGFCPRCEVFINGLGDLIKKLSPASRLVLITTYSDSARAAAYNKAKEYAADYYVYDTNQAFLDIFSFNSNGLSGLYVFKICKLKGEVLTGGINYFVTPEFAKELTRWTERMPTHDYAIDENGSDMDKWELQRPQCPPIGTAYTDYPLALEGQMLSHVFDIPKFDGDHFYYTDKLSEGVMLFNIDGDSLRFKAHITADSTERYRFINVRKETRKRISDDELSFIPLATNIIDSTRIGVSYSLPDVSEDTVAHILKFYNEPVLLMRDLNTLKPLPLYEPFFDIENDTLFFYQHFNFCPFKGNIIYSCQKMTFPMEYERWEYEHKPGMNPFAEEFYRSGNPWLAAFSLKTGKLARRFAELEPCAEAGRTGYYFQNPLMYSDGNELLYSDGFSGTVHITRSIDGGPVESYSAFAVDTAAFPRPDTAMFYRREYFKAYDRFYYRCIMHARMNANKVCCLVMYSRRDVAKPGPETNDYTLVTIDRRTGLATERLLPRYPGLRPMGYGLRSANGQISPFGFYRRSDGSYVVRVWEL